MSETTTVDVEITASVEAEPARQPVLLLQDVERTYRQGEEALHILRGAVNVAVQRELQRDAGAAQGAR